MTQAPGHSRHQPGFCLSFLVVTSGPWAAPTASPVLGMVSSASCCVHSLDVGDHFLVSLSLWPGGLHIRQDQRGHFCHVLAACLEPGSDSVHR